MTHYCAGCHRPSTCLVHCVVQLASREWSGPLCHACRGVAIDKPCAVEVLQQLGLGEDNDHEQRRAVRA